MKDKIVKSQMSVIREDDKGKYKICPVCNERFYKTEFQSDYAFNIKKFCNYLCCAEDRKKRKYYLRYYKPSERRKKENDKNKPEQTI